MSICACSHVNAFEYIFSHTSCALGWFLPDIFVYAGVVHTWFLTLLYLILLRLANISVHNRKRRKRRRRRTPFNLRKSCRTIGLQSYKLNYPYLPTSTSLYADLAFFILLKHSSVIRSRVILTLQLWDEHQYLRDIIMTEQKHEMKSSLHVTTRISKQTNKQLKWIPSNRHDCFLVTEFKAKRSCL